MDELRAILDSHERHQAKSLLADFVVRHNLTQDDVEDLLALLTRRRAPSRTTAPRQRTHVSVLVDHPSIPKGPDNVRDTHPVSADSAASDEGQTDEEPADDGPDWMFGDEPEPSAIPASRDAVGMAFDDLFGDWTRSGGRVTRAEVALLVTRRGLSAAQHGELLSLLEDAGVDLPTSVEARPSRSADPTRELNGDSVRHYLREIGRHPLIGASREVELWSMMKQGEVALAELDSRWGDLSRDERRSLRNRVEQGHNAHTALVCANLRLVVSIAKARHYDQSGLEFADRIQHGNIGLMHAAHLFDGSKGYKFSTYATWWIRQRIERAVADEGRVIRIPVHVHEQVQKVRKAIRKLTGRLDREPTLREVSDAADMEPGKVQAMLDFMQPIRSIDVLLGDEGDLRLSDVLANDDERDGRTDPAEIVGHTMLRADIDRTLKKLLPERAVGVLQRRYGLDTGEEETLEEIGADFGVTRERIRQIQAKAMATLREHEGAAPLRAYVTDEPAAIRPTVPPKGKRDE
uniref:sigma-70 family RNA polymerase sigma factor n=1 Tax=Paractinoplanes polyasparticus TaxID=2856853 RepID=UPI001C8528BA|nr:sigma-70 family RNA polymerase sigma factor [Actinoplanes polyasparticus]